MAAAVLVLDALVFELATVAVVLFVAPAPAGQVLAVAETVLLVLGSCVIRAREKKMSFPANSPC